jgi:hypothetical protein
MLVSKIFIFILLFVLVIVAPISSFAQYSYDDVVTLTGDLYGRSTPNFYGENNPNIKAVVPSDAKGIVRHVKQLTGGYGVEIQIIPPQPDSRGSETAKVGQTYWIYYSDKHPYMKFPVKGMDPSSFLSLGDGTDDDGIPVTTSKVCKLNNSDQNVKDLKKFARAASKIKNYEAQPLNPPTRNAASDPTDPLARYQNNPDIQNRIDKMIGYAQVHAEGHSDGECYHNVKAALLHSGVIQDPHSSLHNSDTFKASMAVQNLTSEPYNMTNLLDSHPELAGDPNLIPKGAVVVYASDHRVPGSHSRDADNEIDQEMRQAENAGDQAKIQHLQQMRTLNDSYDLGHVEIKANNGNSDYYSDFTENKSFVYSHYNEYKDHDQIIGVLIPSN